MATSHCMKEDIWLRQLWADLGVLQKGAISIIWNNKGCTTLAKNHTHYLCTKHINVQNHFIRENLEEAKNIFAIVLPKYLQMIGGVTRAMG